MKRSYYSDTIAHFCATDKETILGELTKNSDFPVIKTQVDAWLNQIQSLWPILATHKGSIYFEYSIPRMGKRIDVLLLIGPVIFILEYKVGAKEFEMHSIDQVWDYALDLKNFHETSHDQYIAPILIPTKVTHATPEIILTPQNDKLFFPIKSNNDLLKQVLDQVLDFVEDNDINTQEWEKGRYSPTPTIIEAARALYNGHNVADISRSDASASNLSLTSDGLSHPYALSQVYLVQGKH
jgi:hypothetical protein